MRSFVRVVVGAVLTFTPMAQAKEHHVPVHATKPKSPIAAVESAGRRGIASWYAQGKRMANGKLFDRFRYTAASRTLPFGTRLRVTNLNNGRSTLVTITDRGPWIRSRILDLALRPAQDIGCFGLCPVEYTVLPRTT